ncbi:cytochrome c oxidase accessory protein CcoG [Litoribacillus peritrichatus]|uniref:Cytochrome c oxidase accessory protein CcoG n=1 Tax=Litoribacillus peritrichatus TaxID=718191 RepID=A0ABP7M303_9GAMM
MNSKIDVKQLESEPSLSIVESFNQNVQSSEKIQVKAATGFHSNLRKIVAGLGFLAFFGCVWLQWGGHQAVLWDLSNRQFLIFGLTVWPQDLYLLSFALVISAFGLFAVTTLYGRVWCGYACPQSTWSWVFIWIENYVEGDRNKRRKLDKQPWSLSKFAKKSLKHLGWFTVAFFTGLTFVGYFTPIRELVADIISLDISLIALSWVMLFTVLTYLNAGWLREQVCLHMCPYARFQAVMFDSNTMVISYDEERGEPRTASKRKRNPEWVEGSQPAVGDCVDCTLCVQVCPTDIDIRDGLQYECISCGKCIDACNSVMDKMGFARGLISYTSENKLKHKASSFFSKRFLGYSTVLTIMVGCLTFGVLTLPTVDLEVDRGRGASLYRENYLGDIVNSYNLRVMNKTQTTQTFEVKVTGLDYKTVEGLEPVTLDVGEVSQLPVAVTVKLEKLSERVSPIQFEVWNVNDPDQNDVVESRFVAPVH